MLPPPVPCRHFRRPDRRVTSPKRKCISEFFCSTSIRARLGNLWRRVKKRLSKPATRTRRKQKVSDCFCIDKGFENFCVIRSCPDTLAQATTRHAGCHFAAYFCGKFSAACLRLNSPKTTTFVAIFLLPDNFWRHALFRYRCCSVSPLGKFAHCGLVCCK